MKLLIPLLLAFLLFSGCQKPLSEEALIAKAHAIHDQVLTIDTHNDTPMRVMRGSFDLGVRHEPGAENSGRVDFPRMKEGGLDAAFFAVFIGQRQRTEENLSRVFDYANQIIDSMETVCQRYRDIAALARTPDDAYRLQKEGKRAIFLGLENGFPVGTDLSRIRHFYDRGIRYITLCHTKNNDICDSSTDKPEWNGLSEFGAEAVREMNRLGMIVDVSHISDSSFYDVLSVTQAPVLASHSCCRQLCDSPRNLTDDMLHALKENGGVIQICLLGSYLADNPKQDAAYDSLEQKYGNYDDITDKKIKEEYSRAWYALHRKYPSQANVKTIVDHVDHVAQTIGIDYVGIGTDFDGGGGVTGCNDVTEFPNITLELLRRGYSEKEIEKIWGGNFMRVFREIIRVSENKA